MMGTSFTNLLTAFGKYCTLCTPTVNRAPIVGGRRRSQHERASNNCHWGRRPQRINRVSEQWCCHSSSYRRWGEGLNGSVARRAAVGHRDMFGRLER
eukprot:4124145-Prymnesium_polylepis.1